MILDTNVLSELAEGEGAVVDQLRSVPIYYVTYISVEEYRFGIEGSRKRAALKRWLTAFLEQTTILFAELQTLPYYASIRNELRQSGTPIPANDLWIAALVRQHGMALVSRDRHFDLVEGIERIDW